MSLSGNIILSGQLSIVKNIEAATQNLANMNTSGYQRVQTLTNQSVERTGIKDHLYYASVNGFIKDTSEGAFIQTGNSLDVSVRKGHFLTVQGGNGEGQLYTRDGQFTLSNEGVLQTHSGDLILDDGGAPITLPADAKKIMIHKDGRIFADEAEIARLGVVDFAPEVKMNMASVGNNLLSAAGAAQPVEFPEVVQYGYTASNTNAVIETTSLLTNLREYERNQAYLRTMDEQKKTEIDSLVTVVPA